MKKINASIYRHVPFGDCSNNGISNRFEDVVCYFPEEGETIDLIKNHEENAVIFVERWLWGEPAYYFRPVEDVPEGNIGYMMGGCYVGSCDSRFYEYTKGFGILQLHDRTETQETYEMMSR